MGCGFITWSLARQPQLLDLALQYEPVAVMLSFGDPAVFADAIKSAGTRLVCQIQNRTQAERALLADLEAGCSAPVGAIAEVVESIDEDGRVFEELSLRGCVAALDGSDVIRASGIGSCGRARELGLSVAAELFELGARELMWGVRH